MVQMVDVEDEVDGRVAQAVREANDEMVEQPELIVDTIDVVDEVVQDEMVRMQIVLYEVVMVELVHLTLYLEHQQNMVVEVEVLVIRLELNEQVLDEAEQLLTQEHQTIEQTDQVEVVEVIIMQQVVMVEIEL